MRKATHNDHSEAIATTGDLIEEKVVALAEQLGRLVGTVQTKAEGWLDHTVLTNEIVRIQESAAALLAHVNREATLQPHTVARRTATSAKPRSRGPVDAPRKRHRKPLPADRIDKQMGEPRGKKMGQKSTKTGRRGGRG